MHKISLKKYNELYIHPTPWNKMQHPVNKLDNSKKNAFSTLKKDSDEDVDPVVKRTLRRLERFRITNTHSVESLFHLMNKRGTKRIPLVDFASNLNQVCSEISYADGLALGHKCNNRQKDISADDISAMISSQKDLVTIDGLLEDHPVFPTSLAKRSDFQAYFHEWMSKNGVPSVFLVEATLNMNPFERRTPDLQIIAKWLRSKKILVHVTVSQMINISRNLHLIECPPSSVIITQGEPGDAFYIVLQGSLNVSIDNVIVNVVTSGTAFGEKALENDAPRSATITSVTACKLMVLTASEYKNLAASAQANINSEIINFLQKSVSVFANFSHAKLYHMVKVLTTRTFYPGNKIFRQGSQATALYIILSGKVDIQRKINTKDILNESPKSERKSRMGGERDNSSNNNNNDDDSLDDASVGSMGSMRSSISSISMKSSNLKKSNSRKTSFYAHSDASSIVSSVATSTMSNKSQSKKIQSLSLTLFVLGEGEVFGEDCVIPNKTSVGYTATALTNVKVIIVNKKEMLEYFKGKFLDDLISETRKFHENDMSLLIKHQDKVKRQCLLYKLAYSAMGPSYKTRNQNSMMNGTSNSNSISKTLEFFNSNKNHQNGSIYINASKNTFKHLHDDGSAGELKRSRVVGTRSLVDFARLSKANKSQKGSEEK